MEAETPAQSRRERDAATHSSRIERQTPDQTLSIMLEFTSMCLSLHMDCYVLHFQGLGTPITLKFTQTSEVEGKLLHKISELLFWEEAHDLHSRILRFGNKLSDMRYGPIRTFGRPLPLALPEINKFAL
ncbi:hypothetical protein AVEN_121595-1 [Araneus ventricosus]|uniref:Uncharacterized protein n=1 Tax=Araneus ventricosus TaxID=182803 RepID=A0A4Y2W2I5_ARAVE|nr:hypothetical protein AVEN_121595-1 [Araneus ventricosus]